MWSLAPSFIAVSGVILITLVPLPRKNARSDPGRACLLSQEASNGRYVSMQPSLIGQACLAKIVSRLLKHLMAVALHGPEACCAGHIRSTSPCKGKGNS